MISIHDLSNKIKDFWGKYKKDILIQLFIVFTGISSFFIGRLSNSTSDNENIYIVNSSREVAPVSQVANSSDFNNLKLPENTQNPENAVYVASSRGKLYYRVGCGGSKKLSEKNKIFFNTKEQAENRGYKPAENCAP